MSKSPKQLFVILGPTLSGKTTLLNKLLTYSQLQSFVPTLRHPLNHLLTHTTRPPRENEVPGRDYIFETAMPKTGKANRLAVRTYHTAHQRTWSYWIDRRDLAETKHPLLITDPQGFLDLKAALEPAARVHALLIDPDPALLIHRAVKSPRHIEDPAETLRRLDDDLTVFAKFQEQQPHRNYTLLVPDHDGELDIGEVYQIMRQLELMRDLTTPTVTPDKKEG